MLIRFQFATAKWFVFPALFLLAGNLHHLDAQKRKESKKSTSPAAIAGPETLIRNATILTVSHGTLNNTDLLIRDGKIAAMGNNLTAGSGARVIDATDKYLMPGIIDCHSHMMVDAINESAYSVTSMARIQDVLNPTDIDVYRALAGGVTALNVLHGSANAIGGQNMVVRLKYGRPLA
ncbi:MAG: hypothetical protein ACRD4L_14010, partial [Pyrinomonadaceae bacterium]